MNNLKLDVNELEINEHQKEIGQKSYSHYFDYNETFKTSILLPIDSAYRTINFAEVTSPFLLVVTSDKLININVNNKEITNTKILVMNTNIDSLQVANVDILPATVNVYIWGVEK